jgi:hypothetical protein
VRHEAGLDAAVERLLELYRDVLAESAAGAPSDEAAELRAASRYLRWGPLRGGDTWAHERERLSLEIGSLRGALVEVRAERAEAETRRAVLARESSAEAAMLRGELRWMTGTATWRWRQRVLQHPWIVAVYRRLRGLPRT